MPSPIKFGTDGWRGAIAEDYTFANVRLVSQGLADYLKANPGNRRSATKDGIIIGYDMRFDSEYFSAAAAEVLAANGIPVHLVERATPTPVISYSILAEQAAGAVNITASHNPPTDNGYKIRSEYGGAADPDMLNGIEAAISQVYAAGYESIKRIPVRQGKANGSIRLFDPAPKYLEQIHKMVNIDEIRNAPLKIVVEPMWGAGIGWFPRILGGGRIQLHEIHNVRNPIFPDMSRPEPIAANLQTLMKTVPAEGAQAGIATDGDADRCGLVDEHGNFVDQLRVYALIAYYLLEVRGWRGPIVKTISTTSMLDKLGAKYGVPVYNTSVGFKYVAPKMIETDAMIGGEESGGYAFQGHVPERDGILACLYLLDMMVKLDATPSQLVRRLFDIVGEHYYDRVDLDFPPAERANILDRIKANPPKQLAGSPVVDENYQDGFKYTAADGSWLLIRFSGTEPIMRIYSESSSMDRVQAILKTGREMAGV